MEDMSAYYLYFERNKIFPEDISIELENRINGETCDNRLSRYSTETLKKILEQWDY